MNNDILRIDLLVSSALELTPPIDRVANRELYRGWRNRCKKRLMEQIVKVIAEFGFPVAMALGMGYFIYYTWKFITDEVKPH